MLPAVLLLSAGCTGVRYLAQAAAGQNELNSRAEEIDLLISERQVDRRTSRLLSSVAPIKRFGEEHGLSPTSNYTRYVNLHRSAVVWVVSASKPLRFESKQWNFPLVGSFTYLGWFKRPQARAFAASLASEGLDVDLRGAGAYSTLGWFDDPILSTMIPEGDQALGSLVEVVLHESTHATFYLNGQSVLNESVASFVGSGLTVAYLHQKLGPENPETVAYLEAVRRSERRSEQLRQARQELARLYDSKASDGEKRVEKKRRLDELREKLGFRRPINNATLLQYQTYDSGQAELTELLRLCDGSYPRLLKSLARLHSLQQSRVQNPEIGELLQPLLDTACPR